MQHRQPYLVASLVVVACVACGSRPDPSQRVERALAHVSARPFNGVMMIAEGKRVVYAKAAGLADRERNLPLTLSSRFLVGSITKQVTAALVMQQVDAGRIDLEAPIATYLDLTIDWASRVKVRHLLNHTSGIATLEAPLRTEPGSTFAYSNFGYELAGKILEKVTSRTYSELAKALFDSCGMNESQMLPAEGPPELVIGYSENPDRTLVVASQAERANHLPPGGMISTVSDLVRWNQCLHHAHVVSAAGYSAMVTPSARRPYRWGELGYGFGLQILNRDGIVEFSHSGYVDGFISTMTYYPDADRTFVVLENTSWDAEDMDRVFAPHDAVRDAVRASLKDPWP